MALHGDVGVEVIKRPVRLLTTVPTALVHALNLLIPPPRSLVLLGARDRNKGVHLKVPVSNAGHAKYNTLPPLLRWGACALASLCKRVQARGDALKASQMKNSAGEGKRGANIPDSPVVGDPRTWEWEGIQGPWASTERHRAARRRPNQASPARTCSPRADSPVPCRQAGRRANASGRKHRSGSGPRWKGL